mmetsp:Transcript_19062/g.59949  ORF Transcript_19062/g.59949 Transcript_19062/m.59949 type:complete len:280 (+) Transcript_19062:1388-2227(+)
MAADCRMLFLSSSPAFSLSSNMSPPMCSCLRRLSKMNWLTCCSLAFWAGVASMAGRLTSAAGDGALPPSPPSAPPPTDLVPPGAPPVFSAAGAPLSALPSPPSTASPGSGPPSASLCFFKNLAFISSRRFRASASFRSRASSSVERSRSSSSPSCATSSRQPFLEALVPGGDLDFAGCGCWGPGLPAVMPRGSGVPPGCRFFASLGVGASGGSLRRVRSSPFPWGSSLLGSLSLFSFFSFLPLSLSFFGSSPFRFLCLSRESELSSRSRRRLRACCASP